MKRMFIEDGSLSDTPEELDIKADLTGGEYPIYGDGLYITEDYGDGRVKIEELETVTSDDCDEEETWYEVGVYWEKFGEE